MTVTVKQFIFHLNKCKYKILYSFLCVLVRFFFSIFLIEVISMDRKKILFSFIKTKNIEKTKTEEPKEYIAGFENNAIKVIDVEKPHSKLPLVIPMKPTPEVKRNKTAEDIKKIKKDDVNNETLDQMAVRELLEEAKRDMKVPEKELSVPIPRKFKDGAQESTLDDYETIPIQEFGMAMLRGMGWDPNLKTTKCKQPELRPKGLGLGAGKVFNRNKTENQEELALQTKVKVTSGKYAGFYGKVIGINEDTSRVVVELTMKSEIVSLNEFMLKAVTEYDYESEAKKQFYKNRLSPRQSSVVTEDLTAIPGTSGEMTKTKNITVSKSLKLKNHTKYKYHSSETDSSD